MNRCMKYYIFYIFFFVCGQFLLAEEKFKVLYIDLDYVYEQSKLKIKTENELRKKRKFIETTKLKLEDSLRSDKKYLAQLESFLGYAEYNAEYKELYQKKLGDKEKEFQRLHEELNLWKAEKELNIFEEFLLAVETIAEKEKAKIVFFRKGSIVFADQSLDISDQVIALLNQINQRASVTVK